MDDSLKYGIPAGLVSFLMFLGFPDAGVGVWFRWGVVSVVVLSTSLFALRRKNRAFFPFSFAFLSGFNITVVMIMVQSIMLAVFGDEVFPPSPDQAEALKWKFYHVFQEGIGFLFVALIILLISSAIFMRRNSPKS